MSFFRIRYCSQERVYKAIVALRTLPNYVEEILWEQQKQKSLRVNLCRKLSRHSTRKDSVSDRKTNTNRFATFGGCNRNRGGESYMFCNSYAGQVHSAMDRSVSILSAQLSTCWQPPAWRTALYEKQLGHAIHRTIFYRIFDKRDLSISKRTANA